MQIRFKNLEECQIMLIKKGLRHTQIARAQGMHRSSLWPALSGRAQPTAQTAKVIADALEVDFDEVFEIVREG